MRILARLGFFVGLLVCTVCDLRPRAAAAQSLSSDAGITPTPLAPADAGSRFSEAIHEKCYKDLKSAAAGSHRARGGSSAELLEELQAACVEILSPQLLEGARQAMPLRGHARARRLTEALRGLVPEPCLREPGTRALELPTPCHLPGRDEFSGKPPDTADAASYMFALTVRRQFLEAGATTRSITHIWSLEFLLRSSIEWERHPEYFDRGGPRNGR